MSSCLIGHAVRYDGGHKKDDFLTSQLAPFVEFVPVCPELEIGLGTPRPTLRLERQARGVRLIMPSTAEDYTDRMRRYAERRVAALARQDLSGYVLKTSSPSCGMERVKVHESNGQVTRKGTGIFAAVLMEKLPALPVEEEGRLCEPALRENFIERVFAYRRLKDLFAARWTSADVVAFHAAHTLTLLAHSPNAYRTLGRLLARAADMPRQEFRARYERGFMEALAVPATKAADKAP